jgi:hypothetical protein
MKKLLSTLFLAVVSFLGIYSAAQAQSGVRHPVAAGKFDVRFTVKNFDCSTSPQTLTIAVQVRATTLADSFLMGDANYRFRFKTNQLRLLGTNLNGTTTPYIPSLVSQDNFSARPPNSDFNYGFHNLNGSGEGTTEGIVSLNTFYSGSAQGAKLVTNDWATVACIKFNVVNGTECFDILWNDNNTFPVTGMNEVYALNFDGADPSKPDYAQADVRAGGFFGNVNACTSTYCVPVLAVNDINLTPLNTPISGQVLVNDSGNGLVVNTTPVANPSNGSVVLNANGTYTYTPANGFSGTDSFRYQVCDNSSPAKCSIATVTITVLPATPPAGTNIAPIAMPDVSQTYVGVPVSGNVLSNDFDLNAGQILTVNTTPVIAPTNGTVTISANGSYVYTPAAGFTGQDVFTYRVCDNFVSPNACATSTVTINVLAGSISPTVNLKPVAGDNAGITPRGVTLTGSLGGNDFDPNPGQTLTFSTTPVFAPAHGTVTISPTGTYTYVPAAGYTGPDFFTYQVCDNGSPQLCDIATVYITVTPPANSPPVLFPPTTPISLPEDGGTVTICVPFTDSDVADTHSFTACGALNGTVTYTISTSPRQVCATYTPNPNFFGTDSVCVRVCDNTGNCTTVKIPVTVTPTNDPPTVTVTPIVTAEDGGQITVCMPITDVDAGDTHTASICATPTSGTATTTVNNSTNPHQVCVTYTPFTNFNGTDVLCLKVCDAANVCTNVNVPITVVAVNDKPLAINDVNLTPKGSPVSGNVLTNDSDPDGGQILTVTTTPVTPPANGSVIINPNGTYTYTPTNPNFVGTDSFTYQVCDNGSPQQCSNATVVINVYDPTLTPGVNKNPVVLNDNVVTPAGSPLVINVKANDFDPDGTLGNPTITVNPTKGTVVVNGDGTVTYTPTPGSTGTDTFTYQVCDNGTPQRCSTATVTVEITPTQTGNGVVNIMPNAVDDSKSTPKNSPVNGTVASNDTDPNAGQILTYTQLSSPMHGTILFNSNGSYQYTPTSNYVGSDMFTYRVCDNGTPVLCSSATVYLNVVPSNNNLPVLTLPTTPVSLPEDGGTVTVCLPITDADATDTHTFTACGALNGTVTYTISTSPKQVCATYTPNPNFFGTDSICVKVCDNNGGCTTVKIPVTVTPTNDPPVVTVPPISTPEDGGPITVCMPITDPEPTDVHAFTVCGNPKNGTSVVSINNITHQLCITYTPFTNFNGKDSVCVRVCDANGACTNVVIPITVTSVNDKPTAVNDVNIGVKGSPISGNVLTNDFDVDGGQTLTVSTTPVTPPTNGTVIINANGTYTYTPNPNFTGSDSFTYQVCDNGTPQQCSTATVYVSVYEPTPAPNVNRPPIAVCDHVSTPEGTPIVINVKANDVDPDGNALGNPTITVNPTKGTVIVNANGTVTYTPNAGATGSDTFTYQICDNGTPIACSSTTVIVDLTPITTGNPIVNLAPNVMDDVKQTTKNVPVNGSVALNDSDPNAGQTLVFTQLTSTLNGTITNFNPITGTYTYTPNNNFVGVDAFTYKACDNGTPVICKNATVYITVTNVNSVPPVLIPPTTTPSLPEDGGSVTICLPIIDADANDVHSFTPCGAMNGTVSYTINNASTPHQVCVTYTPNPNFFGTDSICVKVCDSFGNCTTVKMPVTVTPVADAPMVTPILSTVPEDGTVTNCFPIMDADANDTHSVTLCGAPKHGGTTVTVRNNTTPHQVCVTYTPLPGYFGKDTVCVRVCDSFGMCTNVLFPFDVLPKNHAPIAMNDIIVTNAGVSISGNVSTNDRDPDGNPLIFYGPMTGPSKGTVVMNANGTYTYTPNAGASGTDMFTYQVCDNGVPALCSTATVTINIVPPVVSGTNAPPVAMPDMSATPKGQAVTINVMSNDADPDGGILSNPTITTQPAKGTVVVNANGTITYTPNPTATGTDTFMYQVCDNGSPVACAITTVTVTILPSNNTLTNEPPVPTDDAMVVVKNGSIISTVATNDFDPNTGQVLNYINISNPANGTLSFNSNGTFLYIPNTGFVGNDSFMYRVCDNGNPVMCSNAMVYFTVVDPTVVVSPNVLPVALGDNATTPVNTPVVITVKSNDTYLGGSLGLPAAITSPSNGIVVTNGNGTMTYTPNANFVGIDSYSYRVCDALNPAKCATAVVTINVKSSTVGVALNNPPVAIDDYKTTPKGTSVSASVAMNDMDPDAGQILAFQKLTNPANGTIIFNANGTYTYTPNATFSGTDMFTYRVCDNGNPVLCAVATAYITVLDKPCMTFDFKVILEGPYNASTGLMGTTLNQRGLLPGQTPVGSFAIATPGGQPYNVAPFNYAGTETMTAYPATVVDWVLVSLRTDITKASEVFKVAGLLHNDGRITFVNPCFQLPNGSYYVLVEHRNHMGVMTPTPVPVSAGKITYDFTAQQSYQLTNPPSFGQKPVLNKFVMYAGDGQKTSVIDNYDINFKDSILWKSLSGSFDVYLLSDFNLDADSNFMDSSLWKSNSGRFSGILH